MDYDRNSGVFLWKERSDVSVQWNGRYAGTVAGKLNDYDHRIIMIFKSGFRASRLAWMYVYGKEPEDEIDHKNRISHDDRIDNLREATSSQNKMNRRGWSKRSMPKGVCIPWNGKRFYAQISVGGKFKYLGMHNTKEQAHAAYVLAAKKSFGEFYHGG